MVNMPEARSRRIVMLVETTASAASHGRVAVVTGGSRGLGRAIALALAEDGYRIVVASRNLEPCREKAAEVTTKFGVDAAGYAAPVGRWAECDRLADTVYADFGRADVLVNNAGIAPTFASLGLVSEELSDKTHAVDLTGPFRLSALFGERMVEAGGGAIVNIWSMASVRPTWTEAPYAAAEAGLNSITLSFAQALGPSVRVNAVVAGAFLTDIAQHRDPQVLARTTGGWPLRRAGDPREVVGIVRYLLSDAASFTTGALISVDGGRTAAP
jgi:NAD(P)-dependent dehydrogenase (short-subunit alcohol dehydrogenase family)